MWTMSRSNRLEKKTYMDGCIKSPTAASPLARPARAAAEEENWRLCAVSCTRETTARVVITTLARPVHGA